MRTLLTILILLMSITLSAQAKKQPADTTKTKKEAVKPKAKKEPVVLICNSKDDKVYHKHVVCKGLKGCRTRTVTLAKAKEMGRKECNICYK